MDKMGAHKASFFYSFYLKLMAKTRAQKEIMLADYVADLKAAQGIILFKHTKLTPNEVTKLKSDLAKMGNTFHVIKNRIFKIALDQSALPEMEVLAGDPNAVVFVNNDVAGTSKLLNQFLKDTAVNKEPKIEFRAGLLEGQLLSATQVSELADLPTKEQSIAAIAGILTQPLSGVVTVLEDAVKGIIYVLQESKAKQA